MSLDSLQPNLSGTLDCIQSFVLREQEYLWELCFYVTLFCLCYCRNNVLLFPVHHLLSHIFWVQIQLNLALDFDLQDKQEVVIEKIVRNKRKCITTVKGLELFGEQFVPLILGSNLFS